VSGLPAGLKSAYRLILLGTRGYVDLASDRHRRHSALAVDGPAGRLLIDCGQDRRGRVAARGVEARLASAGTARAWPSARTA
jgi:hypothetical protein